MKSVFTSLVVVAVVGCADAGNFNRLAQPEQAAFNRCTRPIEPAIGCEGLFDVSLLVCIAHGKKSYADELTPRSRKEWLVANGCPPSMVQPEKAIADDDQESGAPLVHSPEVMAGATAGAAAAASSKRAAPGPVGQAAAP